MSKQWRRVASLVFALALVVGTMAVAAAAQGPPEQDSDHPACDNPGDGPEWCDEEGDDEDPDPDPEPEQCTEEDKDGLEGTGVASGVVEQIRQGAEDGGAPAELTDGIDTLNCDVIVTVEQSVEGDGGGGGGEDPEVPEDCSGIVEQFEANGAPAELTDGMQQLCDAIEDDGGGGGEDPTEQIVEGCHTVVGELSGVDPAFEEAGAACDGLEEVPSP